MKSMHTRDYPTLTCQSGQIKCPCPMLFYKAHAQIVSLMILHGFHSLYKIKRFTEINKRLNNKIKDSMKY